MLFSNSFFCHHSVLSHSVPPVLPHTQRIDISVLEVSKERVVCQMPITKRVTQPFGILHGGTTVALAESVASIASQVNVDPMKKVCLGLEINANHISPGFVGDTLIATGYPISIGKTNQVWGVSTSCCRCCCGSSFSRLSTRASLPLPHYSTRSFSPSLFSCSPLLSPLPPPSAFHRLK